MAVDERRRTQLHRTISGAWGEEAADTLFELVAPAGERPATERQVDRLATSTERQISDLAATTERRISDLAATTERQFSDVDQRFAEVDRRFTEVDHRFDVLDQRLEGMEHRITATFERRINQTFTAQTRTLVVSQLGAVAAIAALAFGLR